MQELKSYTITLDDDPSIHRIIAKITGIPSLPFTCPEKLIDRVGSYSPVGIFVDIHLDIGISGIDFLPKLREGWKFAPIISITSDPSDALVGKALASGANDFIRKPIMPSELLGRLQARIAEMQAKQNQEVIALNNVLFNTKTGSLDNGSRSVYLPKMESNLLLILGQNLGMNLSKETLKRRIWGNIKVSENALDKKISTLRKAFKEVGANLQVKAIYGSGVALQKSDVE